MSLNYSLVRKKEGDQREEDEEAGGRRKGRMIGTSTPGMDVPTGPTRSGVSDARNRRKHGRPGVFNSLDVTRFVFGGLIIRNK